MSTETVATITAISSRLVERSLGKKGHFFSDSSLT
jgi:hypothetical protein